MKIKAIVIFIFSSITLIAQKSIMANTDSTIIEPNLLWRGVSKDVIFTTFVTISIFLIGLIIKYLYEFCIERKRLQSIKKYFIKLITSLYEPIKVQCSSYMFLSNNIANFQKLDFAFEENPRLNTEGLKQVSQYDYYKSFITISKKKNRDQVFNSLISIFNILKSIELQKEFANVNYRDFISRHREYINSFNNSVNKLLRANDSALSVKQDGDVLIIEMQKILSSVENREGNIQIIKERIIDPLYDLFVNTKADRRSLFFLEIVISIRKSYSDLEYLRDIHSKLFNNFSSKLNSMQQELINNIKVFENKVNN